MSHLSITGLVPRPSVQVMIRALRLLIQVVDEPGGICNGDLVLSGFSSRGIAQCRRYRFSRGLRRMLIPEILILYRAGNCRTGGNCLLLYSLHLGEGSRQLYMNVCEQLQPCDAAEKLRTDLPYADLRVSKGGTMSDNQIKHWNLITHSRQEGETWYMLMAEEK